MISRLREVSRWWDRMEDEHGWFEALEICACFALTVVACVMFAVIGGA